MSKREAEERPTRRARIFLAVLGGAFVAIALWFGAADPHLDYRVSACALIGAALIGIARFAPDRWVTRVETLLTGWP